MQDKRKLDGKVPVTSTPCIKASSTSLVSGNHTDVNLQNGKLKTVCSTVDNLLHKSSPDDRSKSKITSCKSLPSTVTQARKVDLCEKSVASDNFSYFEKERHCEKTFSGGNRKICKTGRNPTKLLSNANVQQNIPEFSEYLKKPQSKRNISGNLSVSSKYQQANVLINQPK